VLIGLVALVVFPLGGIPEGEGAAVVAAGREMAYPVLMARLLPAGLLGLLFASLLAAFMSTVDTHINWGSSYLVNDVYRRFLRPQAGQRELVVASRLTVVGLSLLAVGIASQITSIEKAWRFFIALGAGLGLPAILRWLWWRVNAWTEIAGMTVAVIAAVVLYALYPDARDEYLLVVIVALATTASLVATFVTPPVPRDHLQRFFDRVRPPGWWSGMGGTASRRAAGWIALAWCAGNAAVFSLMFGVGHLLFGRWAGGAGLLGGGGLALWLTFAATRTVRRSLGADAAAQPELAPATDAG